jgi:hypothetical protein
VCVCVCVRLSLYPHILPNARHNYITSLEGIHALCDLQVLGVAHNSVCSIGALARVTSLRELYLSFNALPRKRALFSLRPLQALEILSLAGNPFVRGSTGSGSGGAGSGVGGASVGGGVSHPPPSASTTKATTAARYIRDFALFYLRGVMVLDGVEVTDEERSRADAYFHGRLTSDSLADQFSEER